MIYHIIGDQETVTGFAFAGVGGSAVADAAAADAAFTAALADPTVKILIVTEKAAQFLGDRLVEHRANANTPFVVEVSDVWNTPVKRQSLEQMIQEAVGVKLSRE
jgi:vacuolar-type H+-ATPase subunit F/Vma7